MVIKISEKKSTMKSNVMSEYIDKVINFDINFMNGKRFIVMDEEIYKLRQKIWNIIFKEKGNLSRCDISIALGIIQYELIHHVSMEDLKE